MTIAFDYFTDFNILKCFFKEVSRSGLCQRLEERELWAKRSFDSPALCICGNLGS
jgi:hypothetical protein